MTPFGGLRAVLALGFVLLTSGCGAHARLNHHEIVVHRYLFGALGETTVDVRDICSAEGAEEIRTTRTFWDYAANVISLGFYAPYRLRIRCQDQRAR